MTTTRISATPNTGSGTSFASGNDGTLTLSVGTTGGSQVDALTFAADGTPTFLKPVVTQTLQDVTASRALGTTYTNSTGQTINVMVSAQGTGAAGQTLQMVIGGLTIYGSGTPGSGLVASGCFAIPNGATYVATMTPTTGQSVTKWLELR